ncbi:hypothetical protein HDU79_004361 [Rhizoclosmatium sp. JEL0117]|nr:hypothetical protein HDU79_004361 [Rhizoclosmatium sp. JEL0117]
MAKGSLLSTLLRPKTIATNPRGSVISLESTPERSTSEETLANRAATSSPTLTSRFSLLASKIKRYASSRGSISIPQDPSSPADSFGEISSPTLTAVNDPRDSVDMPIEFAATLTLPKSITPPPPPFPKAPSPVPQTVLDLHDACIKGNTEFIESWLSHDENRVLLNKADEYDRTALMHAVRSSQVEVVRILVANGADVNAQDETAKDPITAQLFGACMSGDAQFVRDLLNQGARVDSQDESGRTALHHATQHSHIRVVRELIRRGAQVSIQDENGWTALHYAALNGNKEIANLLLESGANEGVKDKDGWTYRELLEMLAC